MFLFDRALKLKMVSGEDALAGRPARPFTLSGTHVVLGTPIEAPAPAGFGEIVLGSGCFWGTEEIFWRMDGVWTTAVGYAGGFTENPTYEEVCSARTGHTEVTRVVYDPAEVSLEQLLKTFWETHDPTQGMRQGNDLGTQYRSAIFWTDPAQQAVVESTKNRYEARLRASGLGEITTDLAPLTTFYYAEEHHQQYLYKNPNGYRCHSTTGIPYPPER